MQQLLRDFWFGAIVGQGACTVISHSSHVRSTWLGGPWNGDLHFCTSWKFQKLFPHNQKQQCRDRPPKNYHRYTLMEEYWFLALMSRLAISSALLNIFFSETLQNNLSVARAKQLGRSLKKTTSCKKATELPG